MFSAYEAVVWMMERVEDVSRVDNAIKLLQNMLDKKYICHASGNQSFPFKNGHHFYCILQANTPKTGQDFKHSNELTIRKLLSQFCTTMVFFYKL